MLLCILNVTILLFCVSIPINFVLKSQIFLKEMEGSDFLTFDCVLSADSIETCPVGSGSLFACGTYKLRDEDGKRWRDGLVHIFDCDKVVEGNKLLPEHSVSCGGVLDMKWRKNLLCSVESEAGLSLMKMDDEMTLKTVLKGKLSRKNSCFVANGSVDESLINLSVDWTTDSSAAFSHSDGSVSLWDLGSSEPRCISWWHGHDNEAWIVASDRNGGDLLCSGGDDGFLKRWDMRSGQATAAGSVRLDCGVTSAQAAAGGQWAIGSYDERLRLYDWRKSAKELQRSKGLEGGVWRVKWGKEDGQIAVACMRGGFAVLDGSTLAVLYSHTTHPSEALAYGMDWIAERNMIACCSFYDAKGSLFKWPK